MKIFLVTGIIFHGLLHFFGFARLWHIMKAKNFTESTLFLIPESVQKPLGLVWLGAMVLFLFAATAMMRGRSYWMILAAAAVLVSQTLIVIYWQDAKAGSLANVLLCVPLAIAFGSRRFDKSVAEEIVNLTLAGNKVTGNDSIIGALVKEMPECVQQWLNVSGANGQNSVHAVHLKQEGSMRTRPDGKWMPTAAEQYFDLKDPAFVWKAKVYMNNMIWYAGRDKLKHGCGNMLIKLYGLVPIVNSTGPGIDQGTLLRFLGELCWFPTAAINPYISWEAAGAMKAKATFRYGKTTVSGIFSFNPDGNISGFRARRYMTLNGRTTLEDWYVACKEWQKLNGFRIPVTGEVTWQLKSGDFTYYKWNITEINYR